MRATIARLAAVSVLALAPVSLAWGQVAPAVEADAPAIALSGEGIEATTLTAESLTAFEVVEQDVTFQTSSGERRGVYEGVLLWPVLEAAGLLDGIERNAELRRTFAVVGSDGYEIDFSVGEVHPEFGATPAMIAWGVDGGPLPEEDGLRLIVPGDTRGARNVSDVVSIEVR